MQLGSTAESLICHASSPVMTVRGSVAGDAVRISSHVHVKRLLVATDFSVGAQAAFRAGAGLARRLGAKVMILHVIEVADGGKRVEQRDVGRTGRSSRKPPRKLRSLNRLVGVMKAEVCQRKVAARRVSLSKSF